MLPRLGGEQHVRGLHVAVDKPMPVRGVERGADLLDDRDGAGGVEAAFANYQRAHICALDPAHADEEQPIGLARLVDGNHVRVFDGRTKLRARV